MKIYEDDPDEEEKDTFDEYSTLDQPKQPSSYDRHGFDERDGPSEDERGYVDDPL